MTAQQAPNPLTIAYVAIGAEAALQDLMDDGRPRDSRTLTTMQSHLNANDGRMGVIGRVVSDPAITHLDHGRDSAGITSRGGLYAFHSDCARTFGYRAVEAMLNGDASFNAEAEAKRLVSKHLALTNLTPQPATTVKHGALEDLTIAYAAIGAARAIDARGGIPEDVMDHVQGEIGLIQLVIQDPSLLWMDKAALENEDGIDGVFAYECAEPFGQRLAEAALDGRYVDAHAVAEDLLRDVLLPNSAPEP